jgi:hypothetical protein
MCQDDTMHTIDVRRLPDGCIDFAFYRRRAAELRREALRDFFRRGRLNQKRPAWSAWLRRTISRAEAI